MAEPDEFGVPVHVFSKNNREQIRISLNEYRGFSYIDVRLFYQSGQGFRPSKKGVTFRKELFPEFFQGIVQLGDALGFDAETLSAVLQHLDSPGGND
ncbi:MAG: transcriptional coactivator p15/PC4 family protein [Chloroflexi bacterium]|nr:transcriptional coactivator p15/PC4 family protein [Chloroflexota bacterium]